MLLQCVARFISLLTIIYNIFYIVRIIHTRIARP